MASSFNNRHWPSMFRSKHAVEPWQAQPDISSSPPPLLSGGGPCLKHTSSGYAGGEERAPDPKPRWNPRPEQIRILEAIFNSGMVNPPRDEIPRIRIRLQEYGHVGDANVFYWFQNRKSRSKNKLRAAAAARPCPARAPPSRAAAAAPPVIITPPPTTAPPQLLNQQVHQLLAPPVQAAAAAPTSSSSSSSDRSSGSSKPAAKRAAQEMSPAPAAMDLLGPLAAACGPQMYYQAPQPVHKVQDHLVASDEPICQQWPQQGYCLSAAELAAIIGGQHSMQHVPVQQQPLPAALHAGAFLGLCNEVTEPAIGGQRTCAWGVGLGPDHHLVGKNTAVVAREVTHEDVTKLGLLQYCGFGGDSTAAVDAASVAAATTSPLAATRDAAVTVASVAATTAALTGGLPATTTAAPNGVVANYDLLQLQGLSADDGALGIGVTTTGAPVAVAAAAAPTAGAHAQEAAGVAALCITDSVTGRSVAQCSVAAARLDVRAQFGEAALLFRCAGERGLDLEPVHVDASGCTVQPLQHGAFYYVLV